jgi:hypothetical protein
LKHMISNRLNEMQVHLQIILKMCCHSKNSFYAQMPESTSKKISVIG